MKNLLLVSIFFVLCSVISFAGFSQNCSALQIAYGETGTGHVGESQYFTICPKSQWDSIQYTVLQLPDGYVIDGYHSGDRCITILGAPKQPGTLTFIVSASGGGCTDTLTFSNTYTCFPAGFWQNMSPADGALPVARRGTNYSQNIDMGDNGFAVVPFDFQVTQGTLPAGLSLIGAGSVAHLSGTPSVSGDYTFSIGGFLGPCLSNARNYTLHVNNDSIACDHLDIRRDNIGGEIFVGQTAVIHHSIYPEDAPPYLYVPVSMPDGAYLAANGVFTFTPQISGVYSYTIRATNGRGCTDTFTSQITVICDPFNLASQRMDDAVQGEYYNKGIGSYITIKGPYTNYQIISGALPPGLNIITTYGIGQVDGTPTASGSYEDIEIIFSGLGGCSTKIILGMNVSPPAVPIKSLYINSVCSDNDSTRNFKIHNPNNFNVTVTWKEVYYSTAGGTLIALPGDNILTTPNVGGPNTIRITWYETRTNTKSIVQSSNNNLCNPPACITVASVDFYHKGLQKNGEHVNPLFSNPASILGYADAVDIAGNGSKAFSLGFDGFVVLQLSADLYDQPGKDFTVHEYSSGNPSFASYPERAEVFASTNGQVWRSLGLTSPGVGCSQKLDTDFDLAGMLASCRFIKIVDKSDRHAKILNASTCVATSAVAFNDVSDGFDIDAVTCYQPGGSTAREANGMTAGIEPALFRSVLYPNPTAGDLTLDFSAQHEFVLPEDGNIEVTILDLTGSPVYQKLHTLDDEWKTRCDVNHLTQGMFIAKIKTGAVSQVYKFIKN